MRLINKEITAKGEEKYTFIIGRNELLLINAMAVKLRGQLPKVFELMSTRNRLNNLIKEISKIYVSQD